MIILLGHVRIEPSDRAEFLQDIATIDPGGTVGSACLLYAVVPEDPAGGRLLVAERWRDQAALTAHLAKPATVGFLRKWSGRMESDVAAYEASSGRPLMD